MTATETVNSKNSQSIEYPNLFRHVVEDCIHSFFDLDLLTLQGYSRFEGLTEEIKNYFRADDLQIDTDLDNLLFCRDYGSYKILLVLSHMPVVLALPELLFSNNNPYYIMAKFLLNTDNTIVKTLHEGFPSIIFFQREHRREKPRNNSVVDVYYCFCEHYYYFTNIEEFDYSLSKYTFIFRDYDHNIIASASHFNSEIGSIKFNNSDFYITGTKTYNHEILYDFNDSLQGKSFKDVLEYRASMSNDNVNLLAMSVI